MAEYRIRHTVTDSEGETQSFDNEQEALIWWGNYAKEHPRETSAAGETVLERWEGEDKWTEVVSHKAEDV